jgi:hypothetical protein
MKNKIDLICNQITVLEMFLDNLVNRPLNEEFTLETYNNFIKIALELSIKPIIKKIKISGQKMENGLIRRQKFAEVLKFEEKYQKMKKEFLLEK